MADAKISTVPKVERNEGIVPQSTNSSKREKTTWRYMARPARPAFSRWRPRVRNVCAANPNIYLGEIKYQKGVTVQPAERWKGREGKGKEGTYADGDDKQKLAKGGDPHDMARLEQKPSGSDW